MPAFESKSFTVGSDPSDLSHEERQQNWNGTFKNSCTECDRLGYAQSPMKHIECSGGCGRFYCPDHRTEHFKRIHNLDVKP
jgi:hypothetical protein